MTENPMVWTSRPPAHRRDHARPGDEARPSTFDARACGQRAGRAA